MRAKPKYRNRDETEVAILDALADRNGEGMTIFEIRAMVDEDIDAIETALAVLKEDRLIDISVEDGRTLITVDERVVGPDHPDNDDDLLEELKRRFPF